MEWFGDKLGVGGFLGELASAFSSDQPAQPLPRNRVQRIPDTPPEMEREESSKDPVEQAVVETEIAAVIEVPTVEPIAETSDGISNDQMSMEEVTDTVIPSRKSPVDQEGKPNLELESVDKILFPQPLEDDLPTQAMGIPVQIDVILPEKETFEIPEYHVLPIPHRPLQPENGPPVDVPSVDSEPFIPTAEAALHTTPEILKPIGFATAAVAGLVSFFGMMRIYGLFRGGRRSRKVKGDIRERRHVRDWDVSVDT